MNKHIHLFIFSASLIFSANMMFSHPFAHLTKSMETSAQRWINEHVSSLNVNQKLMYLNLLIQPSLSSVEATIKCFQTIQEDVALALVSEQFGKDLTEFINQYITAMQQKFEKHVASLPKQNEDSFKKLQVEFTEKLEEKIYELLGFFYNIYYTKLYNHIEQQDPTVLYYMFDDQGVIAAEKRVKALPKPAL